jgi:hypothetical protein
VLVNQTASPHIFILSGEKAEFLEKAGIGIPLEEPNAEQGRPRLSRKWLQLD